MCEIDGIELLRNELNDEFEDEETCEGALEILTSAISIMGDRISVAITDDDTVTDGGHTHSDTFAYDFEDNWNVEQVNRVVDLYGCYMANNEIVCKILGGNVDKAITRVTQAVTAVEMYLYVDIKDGRVEKMDKTHEELATRLKTENEELRKRNKLLYRALEEIKDVNDAIMSEVSPVEEVIKNRY